MANVQLRLRNKKLVDDLPPICMYCARRVRTFTMRNVTVGTGLVQVPLPVCRQHANKGLVRHEMGTGGLVFEAMAWRMPIVAIIYWPIKLILYLVSRSSPEETTTVITGVCQEFADRVAGRRAGDDIDAGKRHAPADDYDVPEEEEEEEVEAGRPPATGENIEQVVAHSPHHRRIGARNLACQLRRLGNGGDHHVEKCQQ